MYPFLFLVWVPVNSTLITKKKVLRFAFHSFLLWTNLLKKKRISVDHWHLTLWDSCNRNVCFSSSFGEKTNLRFVEYFPADYWSDKKFSCIVVVCAFCHIILFFMCEILGCLRSEVTLLSFSIVLAKETIIKTHKWNLKIETN